ncbi:MAG: lipid-A-disaccharide synthase [Chitinophagales bacterium]|nr:lipid-A-disaccharide synthase [Chitinophagales bacterium]
MKLYIIAGEASGDLHASNLVKQIRLINPQVQFRGFGGDLMQNQGVHLTKHYSETAFMGFFEVLTHLNKIMGFIELCKKDIISWKPDALILVDYPGFNLRIAEFAKNMGLKVFYYISPQVWAWKASRVNKIKKYVDRMFVILPFEKSFYGKWGHEVEFVGHPLLDALSGFESNKNQGAKDDEQIVALLPGSRRQEIKKVLPVMTSVIKDFPGYRFIVAGVGSVEKQVYQSIIQKSRCEIIFNDTYSLLATAMAAIVTSGTATLETALFNVPEVVCYKANPVSVFLARKMVSIKYISLVNLIADKEVVKELIQHQANYENIKFELKRLLEDNNYRNRILSDYEMLKNKLGGMGASQKTAAAILEMLQN